MKNLIGLVSIVLGVALQSSTLAAKELKMIRELKKNFGAHMVKGRSFKKTAPLCANFNGNWEGTCTNEEGRTENSKIKIVQEKCSYIEFDGFDLPINGSLSIQAIQEDSINVSAILNVAWNDSQTKLLKQTSLSFLNMANVSTEAVWLEGETLRIKETYSTPAIGLEGPLSGWKPELED